MEKNDLKAEVIDLKEILEFTEKKKEKLETGLDGLEG